MLGFRAHLKILIYFTFGILWIIQLQYSTLYDDVSAYWTISAT